MKLLNDGKRYSYNYGQDYSENISFMKKKKFHEKKFETKVVKN